MNLDTTLRPHLRCLRAATCCTKPITRPLQYHADSLKAFLHFGVFDALFAEASYCDASQSAPAAQPWPVTWAAPTRKLPSAPGGAVAAGQIGGWALYDEHHRPSAKRAAADEDWRYRVEIPVLLPQPVRIPNTDVDISCASRLATGQRDRTASEPRKVVYHTPLPFMKNERSHLNIYPGLGSWVPVLLITSGIGTPPVRSDKKESGRSIVTTAGKCNRLRCPGVANPILLGQRNGRYRAFVFPCPSSRLQLLVKIHNVSQGKGG